MTFFKTMAPVAPLFFAVFCLCGCPRKAVETKEQPPRAFTDFKPGDTVVSVNGAKLAKEEFDRMVGEQIAFADAAGKNTAKMSASQIERRDNHLRQMVLHRHLLRRVILDEVKNMGITPRPEDRQAAEEMLRQICAHLKLDAETYAERHKGGMKKLERFMDEEASMLALMGMVFEDKLQVSDSEVEAVLTELAELNRKSAASNTVLRAELKRVRDTLAENDPAEGLNLKHDDEKEFAPGFFATLLESINQQTFFDLDVTNEDVPGTLDVLPVGAATLMFESEECFEFFKRLPDNPNTSGDAAGESEDGDNAGRRGTFVRYHVGKDLGYVVPTPERIRKDLQERKLNQHQEPWLKKLLDQATVVYPDGEPKFE